MIDLIPAIDMIGGKCVRLEGGDFRKRTEYEGSPVEVAKRLEGEGFGRLHVVDLDGAKEGRCVQVKELEKICEATGLTVDYGGGVRQEEDVRRIWEAGAAYVTLGSAAVEAEERVTEWVRKYGAEKFIIGADVRSGEVRTHGWKKGGGIGLYEFIEKWLEVGVKRVLCTDIERDGKMCGANAEMYREVVKRYPECKLIASGGIGCARDVKELAAVGVKEAVIGKAYYEGRLDVKEVRGYAG